MRGARPLPRIHEAPNKVACSGAWGHKTRRDRRDLVDAVHRMIEARFSCFPLNCCGTDEEPERSVHEPRATNPPTPIVNRASKVAPLMLHNGVMAAIADEPGHAVPLFRSASRVHASRGRR
jgi:hypothetical protein